MSQVYSPTCRSEGDLTQTFRIQAEAEPSHWLMPVRSTPQHHSSRPRSWGYCPRRDIVERIKNSLAEEKRQWEDRLTSKTTSMPNLARNSLSSVGGNMCHSCAEIRQNVRTMTDRIDWLSKVKVSRGVQGEKEVILIVIDLGCTGKDEVVKLHIDDKAVTLYEVINCGTRKSQEKALLTYDIPADVHISNWKSHTTRDKKLVLELHVLPVKV